MFADGSTYASMEWDDTAQEIKYLIMQKEILNSLSEDFQVYAETRIAEIQNDMRLEEEGKNG